MPDNQIFSTDLLQYELHMQPVSHLSEQLTLSITSLQAGFCNYLILYVPIGAGPGNLFTRSPAIKSNSPDWSPVGGVPEQEAALLLAATPPPADGHAYQRFIVYNQRPEATVDNLTANNPLVLSITGNVNSSDWTANFKGAECSKLKATDPYSLKTKSCSVNKEQSLLVYIDSFVASTPEAADATVATGVIPVTKVLSGQAFRLSWASNGRSYEVFQDGKALAIERNGTQPQNANNYGQSGDAVFYEIPAGIFNDTTFVLQATGLDEVLYASLTVTVSNPTYGPVVSLIKLALLQTDYSILQSTLELKNFTPLKDALWNTDDTLLMDALMSTSDPNLRTLLYLDSYLSNINADPNKERHIDRHTVESILSNLDGPGFKSALQSTTDKRLEDRLKVHSGTELTAALKGDPIVNNLLAQTTDAKLKAELQLLPDSVLELLFGQTLDGSLKSALVAASAATHSFPLEHSDDTAHCVRVSDGTIRSNIVLQALTGVNSGYTSLNFNGYVSGGEKRFNSQKNRWRIATDQRGPADLFTIDTFDGTTPITPLAIATNGNVGIGTSTPGQALDVTGNTSVTGNIYVSNIRTTGNIAVDASGINNGYTSGGALPANILSFGADGSGEGIGSQRTDGGNQFGLDFYTNYFKRLSISQQGNVGIGTNNPIAKLHVKGGVEASVPGNIGINYFNPGGDYVQTNSSGGEGGTIAAYFEDGALWVRGRIGAGTITATSDRRIKHIVGLSDCAADLDLLKKIRVTDYTYIDKLVYTDQVMKKVIAQEIQELMPSAVSTSTQAVPNVFERASHVSFAAGRVNVTTAKAHELPATGGKMRLYTPANEDVSADATVVDAHTFSFASTEAYEAGLFVYGKVVDDFLSVDYDAVAMLSVSATQALARQVEELYQQNAALNEQNRAQHTQFAELQTSLHLLQEQMTSLLSPNTTSVHNI